MRKNLSATVRDGTLCLDERLPYPDESRVRVSVEPAMEYSRENALKAWTAMRKRMEEHPLNFEGERFTRDELHERR